MALTAVQDGLNTAFMANPVMFVVLALAALVGGLVLAYNKVGWFKDFVNGAFQMIKTVIGVVVNWFVGTVVPWFATAWNAIVAGVQWVVNMVTAYFHLWQNVAQVLVSWFMGSVVPWLQGVWQTIAAGVQFLVSIFTSYFQLIQSVVGAVVGWFMGTVVGSFQSAASWIGAAIQNCFQFFQAFGSNVMGVIGNVIGYFTSLPGQILGALSGAGSWLVGVGQQIIQGLISGVSSMIGNAVQAVANVGGSMLDGVKSFLGIHSPSKRFHDEVGMMIGQGVIDGALAMGPQLAVAMNAMVNPSNLGLPDSTQFGGYNTPVPGSSGTAAQLNGSAQQGQQATSGPSTVNNISMNVQTNADPQQIARELGYQLLLQG
jgi:phage-related protein